MRARVFGVRRVNMLFVAEWVAPSAEKRKWQCKTQPRQGEEEKKSRQHGVRRGNRAADNQGPVIRLPVSGGAAPGAARRVRFRAHFPDGFPRGQRRVVVVWPAEAASVTS